MVLRSANPASHPSTPSPHPLPLVTISAELSPHELSLFTRAAWRDVLVSSLPCVPCVPCESATCSVPCRRSSCSAQASDFILPPTSHPHQDCGSSHIRG